MDAQDLQKKQAEFDKTYFSQYNEPAFEKIRHITLHIGKLLGKLSGYCEATEHKDEHQGDAKLEQVKDEVVPDLLVYALQLSNILNLKLEEEYLKRLEANKKKMDAYRQA